MITKLYSKYFQKSKIFLYPLLNIKSDINVDGVYMGIKDLIPIEDMKIICSIKTEKSEKYEKIKKILQSNRSFVSVAECDGYDLYVFNLENYREDWENFVLGKYSKLSRNCKNAIKTQYQSDLKKYFIIESYIQPDKYFGVYAKLLDVPVNVIAEIGELCNPFDMEKEVLTLSPNYIKSVEKQLNLNKKGETAELNKI